MKKFLFFIITIITVVATSITVYAKDNYDYDNIVENYKSDAKGYAYIFNYNDGEISDIEIPIGEFINSFYQEFGIRIITNNKNKMYYNLNDLIHQGNFDRTVSKNILSLKNDNATILLELRKDSLANYLYGTCYKNNDISYTDISNKNYTIRVNEGYYVGENIYDMIAENFPSYNKYSIWYENGNMYVLDKTDFSTKDGFFINMNDEMIDDSIHGIYFIYKNCPDVYELFDNIKYIKRHIEPESNTGRYKIVTGGADGFYVTGEDGININLSGLILGPDQIACILAHEAQHLNDYKTIYRCPESSAFNTTLKVMASLGKDADDLEKYISGAIKNYSERQWNIG